jgi:hypothetical protein
MKILPKPSLGNSTPVIDSGIKHMDKTPFFRVPLAMGRIPVVLKKVDSRNAEGLVGLGQAACSEADLVKEIC